MPGPKNQGVAVGALIFLAEINVVFEIEVGTALRIFDDHTASVGTFSFLAITHFAARKFKIALYVGSMADSKSSYGIQAARSA